LSGGYQTNWSVGAILYKSAGNFARFGLPSICEARSPFTNPIVKSSLIAIFTALSLATNYALIDFANVKLMDALVFIAAFLFGWTVGTGIAISTWAVYGVLNPYGQAGFPLIVFLMAGECFYAIGGALMRRSSVSQQLLSDRRVLSDVEIAAIFGVAGIALTFAYDLLTNFATYLFLANSLYEALLIGIITGAPFALVHEVSNSIFFALASPAGIVAGRRIILRHRNPR
jgi:hypothetical protein